MKIEEQVLSREQMAHLAELGVDTSDASMVWVNRKSKIGGDFYYLYPNTQLTRDMLEISDDISYYFKPTYTIGDLIEKLPKNNKFHQLKIDWHDECVEYADWSCGEVMDYIGDFNFENRPLIEALYDCLCWVAENHKKLIK